MNVARAHRAAISSADARDERDHEFRATLFGIEATAQGLRQYRDRLTTLQIDDLADALVTEVQRLRTLLEGRTTALGLIDLADALAPVIACARAAGLDVHCSIPSGFVVPGVRDSTAQVVVALLDNARKHAASSTVQIRAAVVDGTPVLYVEDRGIGISGVSREQLFERGVCRDRGVGSGLGLFIARRLMIEQGGSITVRSRPGGGTTFMLRFGRLP